MRKIETNDFADFTLAVAKAAKAEAGVTVLCDASGYAANVDEGAQPPAGREG